MKIINFDKCSLSGRYYGGSEKKLGILYEGAPYMLKFQKETPFGLRFNHISEYLGSHIYGLLGFDCQVTLLGTLDSRFVVACKDFTTNDSTFVPFNDVGESTIEEDKTKFQYSYSDILKTLRANKKLTDVQTTVSSFFDIYIVDAFLGNFDRHGGNWGFLKRDNHYSLAPVFDNGSCLFPAMIDEEMMAKIIGDETEIDKRVYEFPTSQIKLRGRKNSYFQVINSLAFPEINASLKRIYPLIDLKEIFSLVDDIPIISDIHKCFYKTMIQSRYEKILQTSYRKLMERQP